MSWLLVCLQRTPPTTKLYFIVLTWHAPPIFQWTLEIMQNSENETEMLMINTTLGHKKNGSCCCFRKSQSWDAWLVMIIWVLVFVFFWQKFKDRKTFSVYCHTHGDYPSVTSSVFERRKLTSEKGTLSLFSLPYFVGDCEHYHLQLSCF